MAKFVIDGVAFDSIHKGIAFASDGTPLYILTQLTEASIEITADSKDMVDKNGTLIKRIYNSKSGTFSATNAYLDANIVASEAGSEKEVASATEKKRVPFIMDVKKGTVHVDIEDLEAASVVVMAESSSGSMGIVYEKNTTASDTEFAATGNRVTLPTDEDVAKFVITGYREMSEGAIVTNRADEFPKTVRLLLQAFAYDPCTPDIKRPVYIELPSFQPSPEHTITFTTEAQLDFNGDLQVAYCDANGEKVLYRIFFPGDEEIDY